MGGRGDPSTPAPPATGTPWPWSRSVTPSRTTRSGSLGGTAGPGGLGFRAGQPDVSGHSPDSRRSGRCCAVTPQMPCARRAPPRAWISSLASPGLWVAVRESRARQTAPPSPPPSLPHGARSQAWSLARPGDPGGHDNAHQHPLD